MTKIRKFFSSELAYSDCIVTTDETGETRFLRVLQKRANVATQADVYGQWLSAYDDWTHWITLTTRYELTLKSARRIAVGFHKELMRAGPCRIFFAAEPFDVKEGFHLHVLGKIPNILNTKCIAQTYQGVSGNKDLKKEKWNRISLEPYNGKLGAGYYIGKYISKQLSDYDIFENK